MGSISPFITRGKQFSGLAPKLSKFDQIPQLFRKYEVNVLYDRCTSTYKRLYSIQYTCYSTHIYTHFDSKSVKHLIPNRIYSSLCFKRKYSSSLSELSTSDLVSSTSDSNGNLQSRIIESSKNTIPLCYESYWSNLEIQEIENTRPELLVRGNIFVPAFNTSESRLIPSSSDHSCPNIDKTQSEDALKRRDTNELKIYGFISRNRAFHGDDVVAIKSRRHKGKSPQDNLNETPGECRVINIVNRNPKLSNFVATFNLAEFYDNNLEYIRCQPKDTRWPAFKVDKSNLDLNIKERLKLMKSDQKVLCICRFIDWDEDQLEPTGSITNLVGKIGEANSQMEATMLFHGLDSSAFSEAVLNDLDSLIKRGNETRDLNREDMNHLFVLSIDPQDAKDLDDALSIEKLTDKGNLYYRLGIHIADVSHYVSEDSVVDLDARNRATSVYLEHKVYPMLPQQLSEDLCSLLPNRERLCFSVFVDVVESGTGEKIGNDLYIKDVQFKLTKITSKNRLSYDNAKTMLNSCLKMKRSGADLTGHTFESIEELISQMDLNDETKLSLVRLYYISQKLRFYRLKQLGAVHVDIDGSIKCHIPRIDMEFSKSNRPLHNLSSPNKSNDKTGSVGGDDSNSHSESGMPQKRSREEPCVSDGTSQHELDDQIVEMYLNKRRKLDRNYLLKIEKIPKESHELIEEMMLLANTQVAKFLSEKIDLYLLRVHEDTSKDVKSFIEEVLPQNLKNLIDSSSLNVTQVLSKCQEYMDPAAFQSLSFSVLQKFKEAFYSPINKNNSSLKEGAGSSDDFKDPSSGKQFVEKNGKEQKLDSVNNELKSVYDPRQRFDCVNYAGDDIDGLYGTTPSSDFVDEFKNEYKHDQYKGHWGLALPVYLHFTSPIRRYPDLYTHRLLKNILFNESKTTSVELLSKICERCNLQKRRAFDAQKEYKNFAFNRYLQFISFISTKIDPTYLKTVSISRAFTLNGNGNNGLLNGESHLNGNGDFLTDDKHNGGNKNEVGAKKDVWGYVYGDACISNIVSSPANGFGSNKTKNGETKSENDTNIGKTCLVFYIPLLNELKSISCESLGLVPINLHFQKTKKQKQKVKSSMLDSYYKSKYGGMSYSKDKQKNKEEQEARIQGLSAMMKDKRMEFYIYQKVRVLLVPGSKMWTVRFPVECLK